MLFGCQIPEMRSVTPFYNGTVMSGAIMEVNDDFE